MDVIVVERQRFESSSLRRGRRDVFEPAGGQGKAKTRAEHATRRNLNQQRWKKKKSGVQLEMVGSKTLLTLGVRLKKTLLNRYIRRLSPP